jgi:hypothetical protein
MSFFNDTNRKRVAKIMETLELISKSGNANDADREHFQELLDPVIQAMSELSPAVGDRQEPSRIDMRQRERMLTHARAAQERLASDPAEARRLAEVTEVIAEIASPHTRTRSSVLREAAQSAPLDELQTVMAVYMDRIGEFIAEKSD